MLKVMNLEIEHKHAILDVPELQTIYFGGGTPSVLSPGEVEQIMGRIRKLFDISSDAEISFEANPDDLSREYLKGLKDSGINRLSIGIQSFRDEDLKLMRRSHSALQAIKAIENAQKLGFTNINSDLIYGIPGMTASQWEENLKILTGLGINHISAYHLTFEPGTVFDHWRKKKRIFPVEENESLKQFEILKSLTEKSGFIHYEISNFALAGFFSKHNLTYWKNQKYIGIGPSAHSYDGKRRSWNISSNKKYMEIILSGGHNYYESEELSNTDRYNEYILTSLRTMWGIDLNEIRSAFGDDYVKYTLNIAKDFLKRGLLIQEDEIIKISKNGIFLADQIMREFFRI